MTEACVLYGGQGGSLLFGGGSFLFDGGSWRPGIPSLYFLFNCMCTHRVVKTVVKGKNIGYGATCECMVQVHYFIFFNFDQETRDFHTNYI